MTTKIAKWGNSTAVRLPSKLLKLIEVTVGDEVDIKVSEDKKRIIIEPSKPGLSVLLAQITDDNRHSEQLSDFTGNELL
ncbi:AbrB/MazE/SpoVT family DNA-binding domain-containing protein [Vibrio europaeus]|uniref:AbrB/MazE/SpoVT family DNA-binding domain-containing protein n=1 Tax=Vibrio europaeus TaxID=300876 RepID=UPI00233E9402|nr:AbrB/MazE/SpoVT family DNA-binding domain-containing protein [Vibrio europaeus]MDC5870507.1 AbrB/MazE/SpoVT family DNA-binding domain-containing protein [Vibrio europaeus]